MPQVIAESIHRVEIVFRKRERAGGGGSPGIDQGRLQHLILRGAAAHEAASVFDVNMDVGPQVEAVAERGKALLHDGGGDDGIDFHAGDIVAAIGQRARHVPATAGPDDQGLAAGAERVGQRRALVHQVAALAGGKMVEIESGDVGGGIGVDHDAIAAFARSIHQPDARKDVPVLEDFV